MSLEGIKQRFNHFGSAVKNNFHKESTKENIKYGLKITAIALGCFVGIMAAFVGIGALCTFYPAVGVPVLIVALAILLGASTIYG